MLEPVAPNVHRNGVLSALSNTDLALLQPHLDRVSLRFRMRLQSANRQIDNVYFPESGITSIAVSAADRRQTEVALVGREGMTGLPTVLGVEHSPYDLFVQVAGEGQRISTQKLLEVMDQSTTVLKCFLRYAYVFAVQCGYTALANAHGSIEERLARWLLMTRDRVAADEIAHA